MPIFKYDGRDQDGRIVSGTLETKTTEDVVKFLAGKNVVPITIQDTSANTRPFGELEIELRHHKVKPQEVRNFCEQMSTLLEAGVSVVTAMQQIAKGSKTKTMKEALIDIADGVVAGQTLTDMLRAYPKIFTPIFVSIVHVGENTGNLDVAFEQLGRLTENSIVNRRRLVAAIRYPLIVISAILIAIVVMNLFVIPKFSAMYSGFGQALPLPTLILVGFSNFMVAYWPWLLGLCIALYVGWKYALTKSPIRFVWDKYKLKFPIFGDLQERIILSQFTWVLGLVLKAGVPVIEGMTIVADAADNLYMYDKIVKVRDIIEQGENFSTAIARMELLNDAAQQIIAVGEETGRLDDVLYKVATYYEREVDYEIKRLNDYVEPILLAIVGGMVVLLALGIYLPMWKMVQFVKM